MKSGVPAYGRPSKIWLLAIGDLGAFFFKWEILREKHTSVNRERLLEAWKIVWQRRDIRRILVNSTHVCLVVSEERFVSLMLLRACIVSSFTPSSSHVPQADRFEPRFRDYSPRWLLGPGGGGGKVIGRAAMDSEIERKVTEKNRRNWLVAFLPAGKIQTMSRTVEEMAVGVPTGGLKLRRVWWQG